jgi:hypothetical protein
MDTPLTQATQDTNATTHFSVTLLLEKRSNAGVTSTTTLRISNDSFPEDHKNEHAQARSTPFLKLIGRVCLNQCMENTTSSMDQKSTNAPLASFACAWELSCESKVKSEEFIQN